MPDDIEKYAETKVIERMLACENMANITSIIEWRKKEFDMTDKEAEDFINKYTRPTYYKVEWIKSEFNEKEQECDTFNKIFKEF
jgi:hypothetical protein